MCDIILAQAKWLTFCGMLLTTFAALMLAVRASSLYKWVLWFDARNKFDILRKLAAKHERLEASTRVPAMLDGSEIVTERLSAKLKGGLLGLGLARNVSMRIHDRLRRELDLPPRSIERPEKIVRANLVEESWTEVSAALTRSIANTSLSEDRYVKFAVLVFLAGSIMQLVAGLPWC